MSAAFRAPATRAAASSAIASIDAVSRQRELTKAESLLLEREILHEQGAPLPRGLVRALARHGIKRHMPLAGAEALRDHLVK